MSGGPRRRVPRPSAVATNAVRIILLSGDAAKDSVSHAPLLFRRRRRFGDLVRRVGLASEREREIPRVSVAQRFYGHAFVGLMVAQPALRGARESVAVERKQHVALFQAGIACTAVRIDGGDREGSW